MERVDEKAVGAEIEELRGSYNSGRTKGEKWRRSQLQGLLNLLVDREDAIADALHRDLGKHPVESFRDEILVTIKSANYALRNLKGWMKSKRAEMPLAAFPSSAELVPEPLGLVLIMSSWNYPFGLSLEPLIGAIAAGNVVVLKPSELAPTCSSVLADAIRTYLDQRSIKVLQGDSFFAQQLLRHQWDKIFFTGSGRVGRMVMSAAAEYLTPVTLELGGKCPAVVDSLSSSWDQKIAVKRIVAGKFGVCAGQACIGIDYILTEKQFASTLIEIMKATMRKMLGENPKDSNCVAKIVNRDHFLRLKGFLDEEKVKDSIVHGGSLDEDNLFIEPAILLNPPLDAAIVNEEIFGPLLPIITVDKIEESVEFIKKKPKPLTIYAFTSNKSLQNRLVSETSSGSVIFNDTIIQYAIDTLPFGGIGPSGHGKYHGKFSFDTFSHEKVVLRRNFLIDLWFRYPPWTDKKLQILKAAFRLQYFSVILIILGLKKKY